MEFLIILVIAVLSPYIFSYFAPAIAFFVVWLPLCVLATLIMDKLNINSAFAYFVTFSLIAALIFFVYYKIISKLKH